MNNTSCTVCKLGPPPDMILRLPPPPIPAFLQRTVFDDTWLLVLMSSCVGVIFVGIILAVLLLKCKSTSGGKTGVSSIPVATSTVQAKLGRIPNEAVLYPCAADTLQDSRVMWATLTPRGTTRHYLEDHHYETINNTRFPKRTIAASPTEHVYAEPPVPSPVQTLPKDGSAFDNTAFVDYEEPLTARTEYYQLDDVLEPNFSGNVTLQRGTLRPRVSSPTRIENPNLPPLNLQPHKRTLRRTQGTQSSTDSLSRSSATSSTFTPNL
ncbi:uncharacterized protein LOC124299105 isoform X3 [Neodiprion virginianus]|uniref:Uncharacterized protein LOC107223972 isoform X3 n=1 Tax=Neodiprion lecontei TaxID=441921 RepID=A0A6J0BYY0_NEOLC|nr:uncharacterized protein LOC107223972 isoform X3 [Neodiprion lecontei]XP_046414661.1 uncharacterized protein LOC124176880 isoform X3 [Neodiprion fabricii]XP_046608011.1 uncharacterized protein LOC124299105 isoform X3 [Neodiprion virginianus]XP_046734835.1 uncharacterized protein LOC124404595 isoform X3 [Diprion similis]